MSTRKGNSRASKYEREGERRLEAERRRGRHEQIRTEQRRVEDVLEEAAPRFRDKGWKVTKGNA